MKVKCFIPYYNYNDESFDVDSDYYGNDGYEIALKESFEAMNKAQNGEIYKYSMNGMKVSQNEEKVSYTSCDAILYNGDGNKETVDGLVGYSTLNEPYICMLEFDNSRMEEQFEYELKDWFLFYNKLSKLPISDELKFNKQIPKNLKIKFSDELGFESCVDFKNCKIVSNEIGVVLIVDKVELNKCLE